MENSNEYLALLICANCVQQRSYSLAIFTMTVFILMILYGRKRNVNLFKLLVECSAVWLSHQFRRKISIQIYVIEQIRTPGE